MRDEAPDPWLFEEVRRILTEFDPIHIAVEEVNPYEYEPEVSTILPRLRDAASRHDVQRIVHEEFVRWFSPEDAGPVVSYEEAGRRIWGAWLRFLAADVASAIVDRGLPPYEGARRILWEVATAGMDDEELRDVLSPFVKEAIEWKDARKEIPEEVEESIRASAAEVLRRWGRDPRKGAD